MSAFGAPTERGNDIPSRLLLALHERGSVRLTRVVSSYIAAAAAATLGKQLYHRVASELLYTVAVHGDDPIYSDVHRWVLDLLPERRRRALTVRTERPAGLVSAVGDPQPSPARMSLLYDGTRQQTITVGGHRVRVVVERPEGFGGARTGSSSPSEEFWEQIAMRRERIVFTATGLAARDAVLKLLERIADTRHSAPDRKPDFFIADRWGSWNYRSDIPRRTLDTVYLPAGQKERIVDDLADFLGRADDYAELGIPYHRAYLLHGPAGTGKTTIAKALATHFGLDIYFIPLGDLNQDANLLQLVSQVRSGSLLLLEDIDIFHATRSREDSPGSVSMSGLLNSLDGVGTPHGLVTVLTTNDLSVLEEAVIRPGRADRIELIDCLTDSQLADLLTGFLGQDAMPSSRRWRSVMGRHVTPADVIEVLKRHLGKPDDALDALAEKLR